jgi:hypothetical protein
MKENFDKLTTEISDKKQERLVSYNESRKLAYELLEKYRSQIQSNIAVDIDGLGGLQLQDYQDSIEHFLDTVSVEQKQHYSGHGIVRGTDLENLTAPISSRWPTPAPAPTARSSSSP